jgi:hypothetical protein
MRKKEIIWIGVLLVLSGIYIHFFTHWFEKPGIAITASIRPNRRVKPPVPIVVFSLNNDYKLTSLKVVPLEGNKFNPLAAPVWNLASDSNSVPTRAFRYGQPIRGMKPALKGVHPDPLMPGVVYRLILSTSETTAYKDFRMQPMGD